MFDYTIVEWLLSMIFSVKFVIGICQIQLHFCLEIGLLKEEKSIFVKIMHEFQIQIILSFMLQLQEKILEIIIVKLKFLNFVF